MKLRSLSTRPQVCKGVADCGVFELFVACLGCGSQAIAGAVDCGPGFSTSAARLGNFLLPRLRKTAPSRPSAECLRAFPRLDELHLPFTMAVPGTRMRLTVVVEALAEENAHGDYRLEALAAFKERRFAMPVQLDDTFETVWSDIEQRYKTNYLSPQQAATFSIKKLQDAYDCDLDMTDTVGAIFEGEPDPKMRLVKVIPHFIYRETSVVPGSMLRPSGAQKRVGDDADEGTNKRRRVASPPRQRTQAVRDASPNRPIPSTESQHVPVNGTEDAAAEERSVRSKSGMSLVELSRTETGQAPFSSNGLKQESPEPEQSPALSGVDAVSPGAPIEKPAESATEKPAESATKQQPDVQRLPSDTPREQPQEVPQLSMEDEVPEAGAESAQDVQATEPEPQKSPQLNSQEAAIHRSPVSSVEAEPAPAPAAATRKRKDVYQVPSSPDFMQKKATPDKPVKTYGRSPRSAAQKGADALNMALLLGSNTKPATNKSKGTPASITKKARAFQRSQPDEIESTPQEKVASDQPMQSRPASDADHDNDDDDADLTASFLNEAAEDRPTTIQTPARKAAAKPARPGSLKKPSRASLTATPATVKRGAKARVTATPASASSTRKTGAEAETTPSTVGSKKGEKVLSKETTSRMEHLQRLLSASQNTPKRQKNTSSPARSASIENRDQSNKSSPKVHLPIAKKTAPAEAHTAPIEARLAVQAPPVQRTPIKSPVPLPPKITKPTPASPTRSIGVAETPSTDVVDGFRKPPPKTRSPVPPVQQTATTTTTDTPQRSEVPLPPSLRDIRRSSSLQSSPLANGYDLNNKSSPFAPTKTPASLNKDASISDVKPTQSPVTGHVKPVSSVQPEAGSIVISSAESSSTRYSDSDNDQQHESPRRGTDGTADAADVRIEAQSLVRNGAATTPPGGIQASNEVADDNIAQPSYVAGADQTATSPQTQEKPPSGQGSNQAVPWGVKSWGFGALEQSKEADDNQEPSEESEPKPVALDPAAPMSEDEGFADQETYSTAIEDNASRSRSDSAGASIRSSPAVSRRPARFLSHSPTPDASESEDNSDEASAAPSQVGSPGAKAEDESESESSSDSSDDDGDIDVPDLPVGQTKDSNADAPPSSPPLQAAARLTPLVPTTSQFVPSQTNRSTQRTPIPPPTQQSSQVPRSSQSVSVQAADRRRYTGFRSLREQLADTKAAQATIQKKTFDPRTMSLGKLAKGKPLVSFGGENNDSSDDESSSSSSSDSD